MRLTNIDLCIFSLAYSMLMHLLKAYMVYQTFFKCKIKPPKHLKHTQKCTNSEILKSILNMVWHILLCLLTLISCLAGFNHKLSGVKISILIKESGWVGMNSKFHQCMKRDSQKNRKTIKPYLRLHINYINLTNTCHHIYPCAI